MKVHCQMLVVSLAILFAAAANAGPAVYKCKIIETQDVSEKGLIEKLNLPGDLTTGEFMVDRRSGAIVGDFLNNGVAQDVRVVNYGDKGYSFAVVSIYHDKLVELLKVNEYVDGPTKPFVALAFWGVMSGICE